MDYHMVSFILMLLSFISYVGFIWLKYGEQKSISASYYCLPDKLKFLFTLFCWGFAIPAIILGVEVTGLMFFAGAGICFVGAAPRLLIKSEHKIHMVCAISGIVFSQLAILFGYHLAYLNIISIMLAISILFLFKKNHFWWIELLAFSSICYAIGINLF